MKRSHLLAAALLLLAPGAAAAQVGGLVGGGLSSPIGDFGDVASSGYHARLGVQVGVPTLPVAIRLDGDYHRFGEADPALDPTSILGGALGVVFELPGVGLSPYFLLGAGRYRVDAGPAGLSEATQHNGFQVGFGVALGTVGPGVTFELRLVRIDGDGGASSLVPISVALTL